MTTREIEIDVGTVVAAKRQYLAMRQEKTPKGAVIALADMQRRPNPVLNVVTEGDITLIGQVRHTETYDPVATALRYLRAGVDAVSLFTDKRIYTRGMDDLLLVSRGVQRTPVICQDYIINEYHVAEARAAGASAVVLYASVLEPMELRRVVSMAQRWKMSTLVQVSTEEEAMRAAELSPHVIAVGDDLFFKSERDLPLMEALRPLVPYNTRIMPVGCLKTLEDVAAVLEAGTAAIIVDDELLRPRHEYEQLRLMLEFHTESAFE